MTIFEVLEIGTALTAIGSLIVAILGYQDKKSKRLIDENHAMVKHLEDKVDAMANDRTHYKEDFARASENLKNQKEWLQKLENKIDWIVNKL